MTMKIQTLFKTHMLAMTILLGIAATLVACSGEEIVQGEGGKATETETDKNLATFVTNGLDTRTTMSNTGVFKWEAGDHIWVKDDNHTWQQSSNAPTSETASFKFKVPGKFTASNTYTVYYPGKNGSQDRVSISVTQSQPEPNIPTDIGSKGDCGWATATAAAGTKQFNFTLDHKAAFLVFSPYCNNNPVIQNNYIKLTKIEVISDKDLVGTYTLDPATNQLTSGTSTGTTINLTTGGSATPNGFSVPTAATPATNASYVVIKPGTHTLKVRFWLKDYVTNVEGTVTKEYPSFVYAANTYYSMPSELKVTNYTTPYYMWDAQKPYWYGHEWDSPTYTAGTDQPVLANQTGSAYPQSNAAPRWSNDTYNGLGHMISASHNPLFTSLPNANELTWYVMGGDPHWDGDELWTTMGSGAEVRGLTPRRPTKYLHHAVHDFLN